MKTLRGQALGRWLLTALVEHAHLEGWRIQPVALEDPDKFAECDEDRRVIVIYGHRKARDVQRSTLHELLHVMFPNAAEQDVRAGEAVLWPLLRAEDKKLLQLLSTGVKIADATHTAFAPEAKRRG